MSVKKIISIFFLLQNCLFSFFLFQKNLIWLNYYLLFILTVFSALIIKNFNNSQTDSDFKIDLKETCFLLLAISLPTLVYYFNISATSLWLDEYTEWLRATTHQDLILSSTDFQQPPFNYFYMKTSNFFFGGTEFGLRFSSFVAAILFLITTYIVVQKETKSKLISLSAVVTIGLSPMIIWYAAEARPYLLSLFYFSIFIFFLIDTYNNIENRKHNKANLVVATFFWLMSISMQPLFFIMILLLALITASIFNKKYLQIFFPIFIGLVIFLPFLVKIISLSKAYLHPEFSISSQATDLLHNIQILVEKIFYSNTYQKMITIYCSTVIFISCFIKLKKQLLLLFISIFYFLFIIIFFNLKVNWYLAPRYLITIVPIFYLIFIYSAAAIIKNNFLRTLLLFVPIALTTIQIAKSPPVQKKNMDWRELYIFLDTNSVEKSDAYILSLRKPGQWSDEYFIAGEIYAPKKINLHSYIGDGFPIKMTNNFLYDDLKSDNSRSKYLVFFKENTDLNILESLRISDVTLLNTSDFYILKVESSLDWRNKVRELYLDLNKNWPEGPEKYRIYDGLFLISLYENNCMEAKKYYEQMLLAAKSYGVVYEPRNLESEKLYKTVCD